MKNSEKILNDLIEIYSSLYEHRKMLSCSKLFKYDIETVEKLPEDLSNNHINDNINCKIKQSSKNSKNNFLGITTKEEFKKFYYENLVYDRDDNRKREIIIKKYTKADFQEMCRILFGKVPSGTKDIIFSKIQYFYDSLERSKKI